MGVKESIESTGETVRTTEIFENALAMAVRAPSVHNTQPWQWRIAGETIELRADPSRQLAAADPAQRELLLSCGAALHHMRIALAMLGHSAQVTYVSGTTDLDLLARIEIAPHHPTATEINLAAAIMHRHSDRRRYSSRPVPSHHIRTLSACATSYATAARQVPVGLRRPLAKATHAAAARHAEDSVYQRELAAWSGHIGTQDGVPSRNTTPPRLDDEVRLRQFATPTLVDAEPEADASEWLVLCTLADDRVSQLKAGEAASALLLTATDLTLSSCLQTEPLELGDLRTAIRAEVLLDCAYPQALVRVGWVSGAVAPLSPTPRRDIADVLTGS